MLQSLSTDVASCLPMLPHCSLNVGVHEVLMLQLFSTDVTNILYRCCNRSPPMLHLYSLIVAAYNVLMLQNVTPHDSEFF
jgi:hypothetical protein